MSLRGFFEGIGDVLFSSVMGLAALGLRIVLSYSFAPVGNMIIAYAEGISWCAMLLLFAVRFLWKYRRLQEEQP